MLQQNFFKAKLVVVSVIAISIAACSAGNETTSNSPNSASSPATESTIPSSPATNTSAQVTIPGVKDIKEVTFKPAPPKSQSPIGNGFFDGTTVSSEETIKVPKGDTVTLRGWAIFTDAGKPADAAIITHGDNNSLVAVAPVDKERADVLNNLNNQVYKNSGWEAPLDTSTLPADKLELKAWAYDSTRKEARQLNRTHELILE